MSAEIVDLFFYLLSNNIIHLHLPVGVLVCSKLVACVIWCTLLAIQT
jgi:hypothetical protein